MLTAAGKFPGVLLCLLASSQDSHENFWARLTSGKLALTEMPLSLSKAPLLLVTQRPLSQATIGKGDTAETGKQEILFLPLGVVYHLVPYSIAWTLEKLRQGQTKHRASGKWRGLLETCPLNKESAGPAVGHSA